MSEMRKQGDRLPPLNLKLVDGGDLTLPSGMNKRYVALLFFRGAW